MLRLSGEAGLWCGSAESTFLQGIRDRLLEGLLQNRAHSMLEIFPPGQTFLAASSRRMYPQCGAEMYEGGRER